MPMLQNLKLQMALVLEKLDFACIPFFEAISIMRKM